MFFYRFGPGYDHNIFFSPVTPSKPGDIIFDGQYHYLNLGHEISRPEQGYHQHTLQVLERITQVCNATTLSFIHWMVNERFSSYNKVIPLFLGKDIPLLLKYKSLKKSRSKGQSLMVFPSILSIQYYLQDHPDLDQTLTLSGSSTAVQKIKAYRTIRSGATSTLLATHSQIFHNRNNLTRITLMDEHSPYYRTFQDPRYNIALCIQKLKELYLHTEH